ncbi:sodium-dependent inorganic phosphate cotransporter [Natrialba magadii ATCC 43099]|uniref:Sodium-dependent inorganic phosphate cotransporter n=1 Tax=Natrialba magadii (strain ATCC 43099 / DSM 3394 / CCM 3739 / CIP 104546 / IAM 13178 / JCM 8861 / NBRC 102185 / NCIMB 2190 / MS3) TaxID=547559 RepID=D3SYK4_NATMM|nr:sodium-dependent inorganic phosphate cotransporter [Natrialba magadii ATCC 43099]
MFRPIYKLIGFLFICVSDIYSLIMSVSVGPLSYTSIQDGNTSEFSLPGVDVELRTPVGGDYMVEYFSTMRVNDRL